VDFGGNGFVMFTKLKNYQFLGATILLKAIY